MGHGYIGDTGHQHSIEENIPSLTTTYQLHNGYFGEPGQGRGFIRNIVSDDPKASAKDFYNRAAYGGIEKAMENGKGVCAKMSDGTIISFREVSTSDGSPAVEINVRSSTTDGKIRYQKIHFVKGE